MGCVQTEIWLFYHETNKKTINDHISACTQPTHLIFGKVILSQIKHQTPIIYLCSKNVEKHTFQPITSLDQTVQEGCRLSQPSVVCRVLKEHFGIKYTLYVTQPMCLFHSSFSNFTPCFYWLTYNVYFRFFLLTFSDNLNCILFFLFMFFQFFYVKFN